MEMDYEISNHEVLDSRIDFDGGVVKVYRERVRLPDGRTADWERVSHPGAVGIVPLDETGRVVMVRQYRHAVRDVLIEIPAGKLDAGENPLDCAVRELAEEVNLRADEMVPLSVFYNSPGYSDERFHLYLARGLSHAEGRTEPDEFLEVELVGLDAAMEMISGGRLRDAKSIIGVALARAFVAGEAKAYAGGQGA